MLTSNPDIYAIGDCAETVSLVKKEPFVSGLAVPAEKQAMVAALDIVGKSRPYKGSIGAFSSIIGNTEIASCGLTMNRAGEESMQSKITSTIRPGWFGESPQPTTLKLIYSGSDGKVLGCQSVGPGSAERVNIASIAIYAGMTVHDLAMVELCYCPAHSDTNDILAQAGLF